MQKIFISILSLALLILSSAVRSQAFVAPVLPNSQAFTNCSPTFNFDPAFNVISSRIPMADFKAALQQIARDDCSVLYKTPNEVKTTPTVINVGMGSLRSGVVAETWVTGTSTHEITWDAGWFQRLANNLPDMMGVFSHELAHVYQTHAGPKGVVEGMADYVRFRLGLSTYASRRPGGNWNDGYAHSAFFIDYLNQRFKDFAYQLNQHANQTPQFFQQATGESVDALWADYQRWLQNPTPLPFPTDIPNIPVTSSEGSSGGTWTAPVGGHSCHFHTTIRINNPNSSSGSGSGSSSGASSSGSSSSSGGNGNLSTLEQGIFDETNLLRTNPSAYAQYLAGKPNSGEAVNALMNTTPMSALELSNGMSLAAKDHANYMAANHYCGHQGSGEASPWDRMDKYGKTGGASAENVACGYTDARQIIIDYLIDSDIPDRGHRKNLLNPAYKVTGVACSSSQCVSDYTSSYQEK